MQFVGMEMQSKSHDAYLTFDSEKLRLRFIVRSVPVIAVPQKPLSVSNGPEFRRRVSAVTIKILSQYNSK